MNVRPAGIAVPTVATASLLLLWYKRMMIALPTTQHVFFLAGCGLGFFACGLLLDTVRRHPDAEICRRVDNRRIILATSALSALFTVLCTFDVAVGLTALLCTLAALCAAAAFLPLLASGLRALPYHLRGRTFAAVFFFAGLVNTTTDLVELPLFQVSGTVPNILMASVCACAAWAVALTAGKVFNTRIQAIEDDPVESPTRMLHLALLASACFVLMYMAASLKDSVAYPKAVESIAASGLVRYVELPLWVLAGLCCDLVGRRPLFFACTVCAFVGSAGLLATPGSLTAATCTLCSYFCLIGFPCACVCLIVDFSYYLSRPTYLGLFCFIPVLVGAAAGAFAHTLTQNWRADGLFLASAACLALFAALAYRLFRDASPVLKDLANFTPVIAVAEHHAPNRVDDIAAHYGLTKRETEVLVLALRGLTTTQMSEELVVSKSTVKFHITNILRKTGAENRQQLAEQIETADIIAI